MIWGGTEGCTHAWGEGLRLHKGGPSGDGGASEGRAHAEARNEVKDIDAGAFCTPCGAWRGSLGLEPTPDLYVEHLVEVFREVRRVLRADGTCWLNLGDSYAGGGRGGAEASTLEGGLDNQAASRSAGQGRHPKLPGLKPKDLVMMPARVALALQADGWWLRSDIIWNKPNPMPESVTDRPTKAHEYLFLLTKSERYYYDAEAIKEASSENSHGSPRVNPGSKADADGFTTNGQGASSLGKWTPEDARRGRNRRSVWTIPTEPYPEAHFATFPQDLVKPCVLAGTSERGGCSQCGAPWDRVVTGPPEMRSWHSHANDAGAGNDQDGAFRKRQWLESLKYPSATAGWRPTCRCPGQRGRTVPAVVLDPFAGAGTALLVAAALGRRAVGIELNPAYAAMAARRQSPQEVLPLW